MSTAHQRIVVVEPGRVEVEPFSMRDLAVGEVLLRTRTTLVSPGTERAFFLALPNTNATYPLYPGYSNIAEIIAVGDGVTDLQPGDRVACTAGHSSHALFLAKHCHRVPDTLSDEQAVFFNLIAIAMQGVRKLRIDLGESALVMGAGLIGLFAQQLARLAGAFPVIVTDRDDQRLGIAHSLGADSVLVSDDQLVTQIQSITQRDGADVVIEATGASAAVVSAFQAAATLGRVVLLGSARGLTDGVNFYRDVHRKGLTIVGGHEITRPRAESRPGWWTQYDEHELSLRLLAANRIQTGPLLTHRFSWSEFSKAYENLAAWDKNAMGMLIDWTH